MKAVLLARGLGSRMKQEAGEALTASQAAAAAAGAKGMMPIGDGMTRPFLDYVLSALADGGCTSVCFVVAPDHSAIRDYYDGAGRPKRLTVDYAVQPIADGTARAVQSAQGYAGRDPFLVLNSDNLYPPHVLRALIDLDGPGLPSYQIDSLVSESGFPRDRVVGFAAIEVNDRGHLTRIVEKPGHEYYDRVGSRALISMNVWRFDEKIFEACRDVPISKRGEYELPEAVGLAVSRGEIFRTFPATGAVLDLSRRSDVSLVNARLAGVDPRP
ncbi:MAG TPA: sugar phosphate nucleotidyltransferase [Vicinamibacterales bacterium]|nr:sugar phosphate nucleotidyltransferase [Vicinamibacterales bacterium]